MELTELVPAATSNANSKTLRVLEVALLTSRFTDIVDETGLPKSTVHRILAALIDEGFVAGDAEHGYRPGHRFMSLAGQVMASVDISQTRCAGRRSARRRGRLHRARRGALGRRDRLRHPHRLIQALPHAIAGRSVAAAAPDRNGQGRHGLMGRRPCRATTPSERACPPARPPRSPRWAAFTRCSPTCDGRGYALDLGENELGTVCVSAPIYDSTGQATHGLSISSIAG